MQKSILDEARRARITKDTGTVSRILVAIDPASEILHPWVVGGSVTIDLQLALPLSDEL
ncbi:MAG TPA: hypothetical protein VLC46_26975 [Thermoanaerobaculia bacterium]|nr:hypothetical protein [Thermoanaerobaculia bacterium]